MLIFDIVLSVIVIAQFIYLFIRTKNMPALDDLKLIVTELQTSTDAIITKVTELITQLGNSVLAADIQIEIEKLKTIKTKLDEITN
jgi:hypothetical protein